MDLTKSESVVEYMKQATSDEDWDQRCDAVKGANSGYPSFWYPAIIASGLYEQVSGSKPSFNVTTFDSDGNSHDGGTYHAVTGERIA